MRWHCLQHVGFEGPAHLATWVHTRGHSFSLSEVWTGAPFPHLDEFDGLVVLGGPMNVYEEDRYPWLAWEKEFIGAAVADGKVVVGICLGAQLLAVVLGGAVTENRHVEIGWFPVELTPAAQQATLFRRFPRRFLAFHWHGDRFSIPPRALDVARTEACDAQAFLYEDRVVGLQFHLEATEESIAALIEHCGYEITCARYIQDPPSMQEQTELQRDAHDLLDGLLDTLATSSEPQWRRA